MGSTLLSAIDLFLPVNRLHRSFVPEAHGFDQQLVSGTAGNHWDKVFPKQGREYFTARNFRLHFRRERQQESMGDWVVGILERRRRNERIREQTRLKSRIQATNAPQRGQGSNEIAALLCPDKVSLVKNPFQKVDVIPIAVALRFLAADEVG